MTMNRTPWFTLGMIAAGAALIATGLATQAAPQAKTIDVDASEYKFVPGAMDAESGESLTINLKNVGARPHDIVFELDGARVERTSVIMGGQAEGITFLAPAAIGEYVFYCSVGQHRSLGMEGKLTVTNAAVTIDAADYSFTPNQIEATTGADITVNLKNVGARLHDIVFELDNSRVEASSQIMGGQATTMTFKAPAVVGEYVFYCSVGQHRALGMEGKLKITGGAVLPLTPITDLNNPHGLSTNPDGTILVSEGGTGEPKPGMFTPGNADGRVQSITLADATERTLIIENMTNSIDPGAGIVGANHAIRWGLSGPATGTASVVLVAQSGGPGQARPEDAAKILKVADGQTSVLADPLDYERTNNPGGEPEAAGIDSNPWRLIPGPDNMIYIPDAGANDVLKLDPSTGALSTYAIFATINGNDAIPTGMAFDPARPGVSYVAQLAFAMPPAPSGQIRRLEDKNSDGDALDEGENTLLVDGLLNPTDLAFSPSGHLFVTEIAASTLGRIDPTCLTAATPCQATAARTVVAADLYGASALAFDASGNALVATNATLPSGGTSTNASNQITRLPASSLIPGVEPTSTPATATPATATPDPATPTPTRQEPTPTQQATPTPTPINDHGKIYLPMAAKGANLR
jgi:plastocyanin